MSRGHDWTLVDGDPAPGNPDGIRTKGNDFTEIGAAAQNAGVALKQIKDRDVCDVWEGQAADRFSEDIDTNYLKALSKLDDSFHKAGHALQDYATALRQLQEEAARELRKAQAAERDRRGAEQSLDSARRAERTAQERLNAANAKVRQLNNEYYAKLQYRDPNDTTYQVRYDNWKRRNDAARTAATNARQQLSDACNTTRRFDDTTEDARRQLARAREEIQAIKRDRERAEKTAAKKLEDATRAGIRNKNLLQKTWAGLKSAGSWIVDNLETFDKILEVLTTVLGVIAIVCAILPFGITQAIAGVLFIVVAGLSILKAITSVSLAAMGKKSWGAAFVDVAFAALDVVTVGTGSTAAKAGLKGAKALKHALKIRWIDFGGDLFRRGHKVVKLVKGVRKGKKVSNVFTDTYLQLRKVTDGKLFRRLSIDEQVFLPKALDKAIIEGWKKFGPDNLGGLSPDKQQFGEGEFITDRLEQTVSRLAPLLKPTLVPPVRIPVPIVALDVDVNIDVDINVGTSR